MKGFLGFFELAMEKGLFCLAFYCIFVVVSIISDDGLKLPKERGTRHEP